MSDLTSLGSPKLSVIVCNIDTIVSPAVHCVSSTLSRFHKMRYEGFGCYQVSQSDAMNAHLWRTAILIQAKHNEDLWNTAADPTRQLHMSQASCDVLDIGDGFWCPVSVWNVRVWWYKSGATGKWWECVVLLTRARSGPSIWLAVLIL